MNEREFIPIAENFIYKEVAKISNLLFGKNKTAALSTGIFLKLPIVVTLQKVDKPFTMKLTKDLKSFMERFTAYVVIDKMHEVHFTFLYHDEKDIKLFVNDFRFRSTFFAFVYMHELQHILRKHNTKSYDTMMQRIASDLVSPHSAINIAEDHAINYSIKDLFKLSSTLMPAWGEIEKVVMYNAAYHKEQLSDIDILKDMLKKGNNPTITAINSMLEQACLDGKCTIQPKGGKSKPGEDSGSGDKCSTSEDDVDVSISDLAESLQDIIKTATKGTEAGALMSELFGAIKVETGWFKKLKASFKRQVYYKTHDFSTSWANLNNTYRKIYKSPKKLYVESKISIILSVDHSGSVGTEELQKLLYLMESEGKRISNIIVLIHDTRVVKTFELSSEFDIAKSPEFKEALATRHVVGGTSHAHVFKTIQDMKIKDHTKLIYMSFSDNYSDIEQVIGKYPIMRKITKYWICAGANNPVKSPGTNIMMV